MTYSQNMLAFLAVVAAGESHPTDTEAYRALYGWSPGNGKTFASFADHPRQAFNTKYGWTSAAGRYQAMCAVPPNVKTDTWGDFIKACGPHDFSPASQDEFAVWCIKRRHALELVEAGALEQALRLCSKEWASLPFSPYGQGGMSLEKARAIFLKYGGTLASDQASVDSVDTSSERVEEPPKTEHVTTAYVPAGEIGPSEDFAAVPQEKPMSFADVINNPATKVLLGLVNPVLAAVPEVAKIFMDKDGTTVPERNVAAAIKIADVAQKALADAGKPADNMQAVAEAVASDPEAKRVVRAAVLDQCMYLAEAGGGGIDGARKVEASYAAGPWHAFMHSPSFWIALAMLPLVYMIVGNVVGLIGKPLSDEVRSAISNGVVGLILGGLIGYYYGQTTSRNRTADAK